MGAKIVIGFVKSDINTMIDNYSKLIEFISENMIEVNLARFSKDANGSEWVESKKPNIFKIKSFANYLKDIYYFELTVSNFLFGNSYTDSVIRLNKHHNDYYSFLIEFEEELILKNYQIAELEAVESFIEHYIRKTFNKLDVNYAFSGQEAEVEFSPQEFQKTDQPYYALEVRKDNQGNLSVSKANWYINGLTERKKS